ncbi:hypothetical protein FXO37_32122 [Capsicum annuum]|nr:hypothetical protein FXO37_32122 [Capsicum annuum]
MCKDTEELPSFGRLGAMRWDSVASLPGNLALSMTRHWKITIMKMTGGMMLWYRVATLNETWKLITTRSYRVGSLVSDNCHLGFKIKRKSKKMKARIRVTADVQVEVEFIGTVGSQSARFTMLPSIASAVMSSEDQKRYFYASISIESKKIRKFVKGLDAFLHLGGAKKVHRLGEFRGYTYRGQDSRDFLWYHGSPVQTALQSSSSRSSGPAIPDGHFGPVLSPLFESCHRVCYTCDNPDYLAKDCPHHVFRATPISVMRGRGSVRIMRGRGSGTCGGSREAAQLVGGHGQCYAILTKPEAEACNAVIIGIFPIFCRSASMLLDLALTFSYVFAYFALGFDSASKPLVMPICVSTPVGDSLVMNWVYRSYVVTFVGDCYVNTVTLASPNVLRITWKGLLHSASEREFLTGQILSTNISPNGISIFQGLIERVRRTVRGSADDIGWLRRASHMPPAEDQTDRFVEINNNNNNKPSVFPLCGVWGG